jgi:3-deoxy-D-arabino-heptulosonate 7-phosphate (DAHP) synthase
LHRYRVDIVTGASMTAGTHAPVGVSITGDANWREAWSPTLQQSNAHFAKGKTDTFIVSRGGAVYMLNPAG